MCDGEACSEKDEEADAFGTQVSKASYRNRGMLLKRKTIESNLF